MITNPFLLVGNGRQKRPRQNKRRLLLFLTIFIIAILTTQFWVYVHLESSTASDNFNILHNHIKNIEFESKLHNTHDNQNSNRKELFIDRINRLLPEDDNVTQLSLEEIADIEQELLQFDIPRNITIQVQDARYISIVLYRWLFYDQHKTNAQCPNCFIRYDPWTKQESKNESYFFDEFVRNHQRSQQAYKEHYEHQTLTTQEQRKSVMNVTTQDYYADVKLHPGCPAQREPDFQQVPWQVTVGGCGESQIQPSGKPYAQLGGRQQFHYHSGFEKIDTGIFQTSFAYLHLSPPNDMLGDDGNTGGVFPSGLYTMTDYAKQILKQHSHLPSLTNGSTKALPAMFVHGNCGNDRGVVLQGIVKLEPPEYVARYGSCHHNAEEPTLTKNIRQCEKPYHEHWHLWSHHDCEGTIYSTKTALSAFHKFTFALENAHSQDYISEKRWQAFLAGSVPIIWDNHNSLDSLPDASSAVVIQTPTYQMHHNNDWGESLRKHLLKDLPKHLISIFKYYKNEDNDEDYLERFFAWKKQQTLPVNFVRKMFLSADFLLCRICEHVANHHPRDAGGTAEEYASKYYSSLN